MDLQIAFPKVPDLEPLMQLIPEAWPDAFHADAERAVAEASQVVDLISKDLEGQGPGT